MAQLQKQVMRQKQVAKDGDVSPDIVEAVEKNAEKFTNKIKNRKIKSFKTFVKLFNKSLIENNRKFLVGQFDKFLLARLFEAYIRSGNTLIEPSEKKSIIKDFVPEAVKIKIPKGAIVSKPDRVPPPITKLEVKSHVRAGVTIKSHSKTLSKWSDLQLRWLGNRRFRKDTKELTKEFNEFFSTSRTVLSVRDRKLRLRGSKKS